MAYATVEDVEARLGFTLDEDEAQKLGIFLEDFTVFLDALFESKGADSTTISAPLLKMIVSQKGVDFYFQGESGVPFGASSYSVAHGDSSTSVSLGRAGQNENGLFSLTRQQEILLKLFKPKIVSFTQDAGRRYC